VEERNGIINIVLHEQSMPHAHVGQPHPSTKLQAVGSTYQFALESSHREAILTPIITLKLNTA